MRERKYVKFRVDMYADTKFKIIDLKPERDTIHYVWNRIVLLAGKVNLEGDLYFSKSIPYTIDTLAIEFNREVTQIKLAIDLFIELEMIELTEDKIYRVKNFAKHQNIKVKEKEKIMNNEEKVQNILLPQKEDFKAEINENKDIVAVDNGLEDEKSRGNLQKNIPLIQEINKGRKRNRKNKDDIVDVIDTDEGIDDGSICCIHEGVRSLKKDESTILEWSFG